MRALPGAIGGLVRPAAETLTRPASHIPGVVELAADGVRLFLAAGHPDSVELAKLALGVGDERSPGGWQLERERNRSPRAWRAGHSRPISMSSTCAWKAVATAPTGRVGLDVESLTRVRANTGPCDEWLDAGERELLAALDPAARVVELACRWTLREAAGKALGLGLGAWPHAPTITVERGNVHLRGGPPGQRWAGWRFQFLRRGDLLIAIALGPSDGDAVDARGEETSGRAAGKVQRLEHLCAVAGEGDRSTLGIGQVGARTARAGEALIADIAAVERPEQRADAGNRVIGDRIGRGEPGQQRAHHAAMIDRV
jgi:phosphopantetheinyl transferase